MTYEEYAALYPDGPEEGAFDRFAFAAHRAVHSAVTGVDGVDKLSAAPPVEEEAQKAVELCQAALIHQLWAMEQSQGVSVRADGAVTGRIVTAVTAGSESVAYAAPAVGASGQTREGAIARTVQEHLAGIADANGVLLLYAGRYPMRVNDDV